LQSGSPAINKGNPGYTPPTDFYGTARTRVTLGAIAA
jgi:hypothetical protein